MQNPGPRKENGFTLLENILGLGIFIIAVVALIQAVTNTLLLIDDASDSRQYREMVESRVREISVSSDLPRPTREVPVPDRDIIFREEAQPLDLKSTEGETLEGLYSLTVTAIRKNALRENVLAKTTIWVNTNRSRR